MPELPDVEVYVEALRERVVGRRLERAAIRSPFLLRTFEPPLEAGCGRAVVNVSRLGKRIVIELTDAFFLAIHLMIAGRLRWMKPGAGLPARIALAVLEFESGALVITEAGRKKRAALHVASGRAAVEALGAGGLEPLACDAAQFAAALRRENHTLKRALTDPRLFSGIGNAYSDEILHAARLSPAMLTSRLSDQQAARLFEATRTTLAGWVARLRAHFAGRFPGPGEITALRPAFAVHGRYGEPCRDCGTTVQRIRYAENETNYCPRCQTEGRLLADRSLSRLLRQGWPRRIEDLHDTPPAP
ncbi:MAG: formamidopyrimidine-DNA glycosylase [Phycisphaerae bacterium]|nr:formamidopyrimidine-DNA glycosylase [Phycisphaerae bacterium]MCZ2399557.1 formamidopyrimidine-DNA glycosylase [Phycisphaerae bacterium]